MIRFSVSDTGIGVPLEKQQLIFEAFKQADDSISQSYGGTGLGLSIVKTLIEHMGGNVGVISDGENGSTFFFTIPYFVPPRRRSSLTPGSAEAPVLDARLSPS